MKRNGDKKRRPGRLGRVAQCIVAGLTLLADAAWAQPAAVDYEDARGDVVARPMDPGATLPFDLESHRPIDLLGVTLGRWDAADPQDDPFVGSFATDGPFFLLELRLDGRVNPPGETGPTVFDPFRYGPDPVYGFVEIDMDGDVDTGGELDAPEYRYLGNAVRFGGKPTRSDFSDRVALDAGAFDADFLTPPFVERHGEEFHLALLGGLFGPSDIVERVGNGNAIFDAGETWHIRAPFFHRAHGYEPFSFAKGGHFAGEYAPVVDVRFRHDTQDDLTIVAMLFPLTNTGAGLLRGEPAEATNQDPTDHASVLEALEDLQLSAFFLPIFPTGMPEEDILRGWADRDPVEYLDPTQWDVTATLGTSYTASSPQGVFFVWTDIYPDVVPGDVDGSGGRDGMDTQRIAQHIAAHDPLDGLVDGIVTIFEFAEDFSVYDVNHDGYVDSLDLRYGEPDGDTDDDGDVDLADFAVMQSCLSATAASGVPCWLFDFSNDGIVNSDDQPGFNDVLRGPFRF